MVRRFSSTCFFQPHGRYSTILSTHNNGTATINARQIINLPEGGTKVVQEINGMANNFRIAVSVQHCIIGTTRKRFGNLICFHVQIKSGSHRNSPRHALNTEPVSEIIYCHPRTEADLASGMLCCAVLCCVVLCCVVLCCAVLYCVVLCCVVLCCVVLYCVVLCCVVLCCVVLCCVVLCCAVLCCVQNSRSLAEL
jgi:hypothetical protein